MARLLSPLAPTTTHMARCPAVAAIECACLCLASTGTVVGFVWARLRANGGGAAAGVLFCSA